MMLRIKKMIMTSSFVTRWKCNECGKETANASMKGEVKCSHCGSKSLTPS